MKKSPVMKKAPYYAVGLNTINLAPSLVLLNGVPVATGFQDFHDWFIKNNLDVKQFRNWPFVEGIKSLLK